MRAKNPYNPGRLTGALLIVAAAVLGASLIPGVPSVVESIGIALIGAAAAATADVHLRVRKVGVLLLPAVIVAIGDRVAEQALADERPWIVAVSLGAYLVWTVMFAAPRAVVRAAVPALIAVAAPLALRGGTGDAVWAFALLPIALVAMLLASPGAKARAARDELASNLADLDAVVLANLELRHTAEASDAARRTARIATELLDADGAVVWVRGPGRLLCAGGHGTTPAPQKEMASDPAIDAVLNSGALFVDDANDAVVLPLTASGGVFGAVAVSGPRRPAETFVSSVLQVFGAQAGYALERLRTVESLIDVRFVDPVTGVGNRQAATASLATLRPGDAVLLLALDDLERIREEHGDARADLTLGQLGLHLRTGTRAGDLVARFADDVFFILLRDLSASAESVVTRLLESWQETGTAGRLRAGAALHFVDTTPLDTLDRASEALDAGSTRQPLHRAAEYAAWGPAD